MTAEIPAFQMLFLFLFITCWGLGLLGWGAALQRVLGALPESLRGADRMAFLILLGHVPVVTMGFLCHLAAPLAGWPGPLVLGTGLGFCLGSRLCLQGDGLFGDGRTTRRSSLQGGGLFDDGRTTRRSSLQGGVLFGGVAFFVSLFAARLMVHGDTGGYHAQAIMWMAEEPVIRGLANVTSVFSYNTSWWMLAGLMSWPWGAPLGAVSVSGPVLVATGVLLWGALLRVLRREADGADWFWLPALYLWLRQVVGLNTPSPTTDIPANLVVLSAIWFVVRFGRAEGFLFITTAGGRSFLALALLAATAKLSASPLLACGLVWLVGGGLVLLLKNSRNAIPVFGHALRLMPLALCGVAYLFHGWLLSGYPLFPSTLGGAFPAPWQLPAWLPDFTVERARSWAFTYGASAEIVRTTPTWKLWLYGQSALTNLLVAGSAAAGAVLGAGVLMKTRTNLWPGIRSLGIPAGLSLLGLAWNLSQVPSLRFSAGFAFGILGCAFVLVGPHLPVRPARAVVAVWCLLSFLALSKLAFARPVSFLRPPAPPVPEAVVERFTREGDRIRVSPFPWFAPKPAIVEFEFDENLKILRSPKGKILEIHSGR